MSKKNRNPVQQVEVAEEVIVTAEVVTEEVVVAPEEVAEVVTEEPKIAEAILPIVMKDLVLYEGGTTLRNIATDKKVTFEHKSDMFRVLFDVGYTVSQISKLCASHYSFVYGVISGSRTIIKTEKGNKSSLIRALAEQGKSAGEIAKELNSNYSFVHSVVKKYRASLPLVAAE